MSLQTAIGPLLWVSWIALHVWLGKRRLLLALGLLVALEILAFAALLVSVLQMENDNGGAGALAIFLAVPGLLFPAAVGVFWLWRGRTTRAL